MFKLMIQFILEGVSFSMQTDGFMLTITLSKGIFTQRQILPVSVIENTDYPQSILRDFIAETYTKLQQDMRNIRKFPTFPPPQPTSIK